MQIEATTFPVLEPNQNLLNRAYFVEQICLILAIQIVLINLLSRTFIVVNNFLPHSLLHMHSISALAVLCATIAMFFMEAGRSRRLQRVGSILAALTSVIATAGFWVPSVHLFSHVDQFLNGNQIPARQSPNLPSVIAFLLLGIVILLIRSRDSLFGRIADAGATLLMLLVLIVLSELLFGLAHIPGSSIAGLPSFPTIVCL